MKGAFKLQANYHWIKEPMLNRNGHFTTHTIKLNKTILRTISPTTRNRIGDPQTTKFNMDADFTAEIPDALGY